MTDRLTHRCLAMAGSLVIAALSVGLGVAGPVAAQPAPSPTPFQTPDTSSCPFRLVPPAPVDHSEAPAPGQAALRPVPLPDRPWAASAWASAGSCCRPARHRCRPT